MTTPEIRRIRIDARLVEQAQWYDIFPPGMWTDQARINYLVRLGLGVLMHEFVEDLKKRQDDPNEKLKSPGFYFGVIESRLRALEKTKLPNSEVAKLLNRSLYG